MQKEGIPAMAKRGKPQDSPQLGGAGKGRTGLLGHKPGDGEREVGLRAGAGAGGVERAWAVGLPRGQGACTDPSLLLAQQGTPGPASNPNPYLLPSSRTGCQVLTRPAPGALPHMPHRHYPALHRQHPHPLPRVCPHPLHPKSQAPGTHLCSMPHLTLHADCFRAWGDPQTFLHPPLAGTHSPLAPHPPCCSCRPAWAAVWGPFQAVY